MTLAHSVPRPAGRLAVAGGLALVVAMALYAFGRAHTPGSTMGLFGQHGLAVNRLKAQLATGELGLTLALWMYRRLPGAGSGADAGAGAAPPQRREPVLLSRPRLPSGTLRRATLKAPR
jgi:hypothetical protein